MLINRILRIAAFQNPEFYKAQTMRLSTFDKPRIIGCGEDLAKHVALPRGCLTELVAMLEGLKIRPVMQDERFSGQVIDVNFHGTLREKQTGGCGGRHPPRRRLSVCANRLGKTAVAAWLIAKRSVNTLILVHRQQLLDQWRERLAMFLDLPIDEVGQVGAGKIN